MTSSEQSLGAGRTSRELPQIKPAAADAIVVDGRWYQNCSGATQRALAGAPEPGGLAGAPEPDGRQKQAAAGFQRGSAAAHRRSLPSSSSSSSWRYSKCTPGRQQSRGCCFFLPSVKHAHKARGAAGATLCSGCIRPVPPAYKEQQAHGECTAVSFSGPFAALIGCRKANRGGSQCVGEKQENSSEAARAASGGGQKRRRPSPAPPLLSVSPPLSLLL